MTAAIAIGRIGVEVVVFERADELREIGAGISLWANAMKALKSVQLRQMETFAKHIIPAFR